MSLQSRGRLTRWSRDTFGISLSISLSFCLSLSNKAYKTTRPIQDICFALKSFDGDPHPTLNAVMADSDPQETRQAAKESPFSIKNLLNIDDKPAKPQNVLSSPKVVLEGSFFSRLGDLTFPRFELSAHRIGLPAQYLERTSAWWYPYALGAHLKAGGMISIFILSLFGVKKSHFNLK